ncbi:hypothetical protein ACF3TM_18395 [Providencia stuartii]|uniref:hypothetical protein n=1 Tax=Providencia stuartii TaxID=588 RepID=UPI00370A3D3E
MSDNTMIIIVDGITCTVDCIADVGPDGSIVKRPADTSNLVEVTKAKDKLRRFITDPLLRKPSNNMAHLIKGSLVKPEIINIETEEQRRIKELEKKVSTMQAQIDRLSQDLQSTRSGWL